MSESQRGFVLTLTDPRWSKYASDRETVAPFLNDLQKAYVFENVQDAVDAWAGYLEPGSEELNVELFNASSIITVVVQPEVTLPRTVTRVNY